MYMPIDTAQDGPIDTVTPNQPDVQPMGAARERAGRIGASAPHAVRMTRRLLRGGRTMSLDSLLQLSAAMQSQMHATADHKEAIAAFVEKSTPQFASD